MYCKYCGKKISDDSIYCEYCGKRIRSSMVDMEKVKDTPVASDITPPPHINDEDIVDDIANKIDDEDNSKNEHSEDIQVEEVFSQPIEYHTYDVAIGKKDEKKEVLADNAVEDTPSSVRNNVQAMNEDAIHNKKQSFFSRFSINLQAKTKPDNINSVEKELPGCTSGLLAIMIFGHVWGAIKNTVYMFLAYSLSSIQLIWGYGIITTFCVIDILSIYLMLKFRKVGFYLCLLSYLFALIDVAFILQSGARYLVGWFVIVIVLWAILHVKKDGISAWSQMIKGWGFREMKRAYIVTAIIALIVLILTSVLAYMSYAIYIIY